MNCKSFKPSKITIKLSAIRLCLGTVLLFACFGILFLHKVNPKKEIVSAFVRVKNEIKTIEACLNSIDRVFDKIVIIHSNEPDDGSVEFMNKWCKKRKYCEIHEYPYKVIPPHAKEYAEGNFKKENTLAAYYNFGLQFFEPEEWVVKIDADQVYLKKELKKFLTPFKKGKMDDNYYYGTIVFNTFVKNNQLVLFKNPRYRDEAINGGKDSFIIKRKNLHDGFIQGKYTEQCNIDIPYYTGSMPVWFHFMKSLKSNGIVIKNEDCPNDKIQYLTKEQKEIFNNEIRPLLKNSVYYNVEIPVEE